MRIFESFKNIGKIPELRTRILWTLGLLVVFRLGSHITLPGVNPDAIAGFQKNMEGMGNLFHLMQIFSGQSIGNLALFSLGIMPYITASIIMQLMTKVSPTLEAVAKEGPSGQRKIGQYTRYLAVPICIVQAWMAVGQINRMASEAPLMTGSGFFMTLQLILGLTAGALFVMWLGEQITEYGVGNGASILIMTGIIARMPAIWHDLIFVYVPKGDTSIDRIGLMAFLFLAAIAATVLITQAQRRIPIQHAKHFKGRRVMQGQRNYLPLRVNTAGVMPVIFASSLLVIPSLIGIIPHMEFMRTLVMPGTFTYLLFFVAMIIIFSYFWTYLFFPPHELANQLKEYGSFIPGIRPGENTATYLNGILARITLAGAAFLCVIALLPDMAATATGLQRYFTVFLGGTGILIVVGVCLDIAQKIESHLLMHHYEGFVGGGASIRGRRG